MRIVNLTQHTATAEQIEAGVYDLPAEDRAILSDLLTFEEIPDADTLWARAVGIAQIANLAVTRDDIDLPRVMIGGAPYLMASLEVALRARRIRPVYAFSKRVSVDETQPDGTVKKVGVFRHLGFVG